MRIFLFGVAALMLAGCGSPSSAPGPTPSPTARQLSWSQPPPMTINVHHNYSAVVETTDGTFTIRLLPKVAPITVNNFVFLARHRFYAHILFHRIIQDFMVQTGDPLGTGLGGPGYSIKDEKVTMPYTPGTVAMANTGAPNSGGSQFFIVTGPQASSLPPKYTIFGVVSSGMKVVRKIAATPVTANPADNNALEIPMVDIYMNRVTIRETP
ncbi:MAG TPA: peptidylprolyl isomerase [Chloroflexota bacterium]|nr:peptidylprolyl isomerase [Chloroflexota bacterium]